jgi:hypothetical protein
MRANALTIRRLFPSIALALAGCAATPHVATPAAPPAPSEAMAVPFPLAQPLASLPATDVTIDVGAPTGPFEAWRHSVGHGGINTHPLPDVVVAGLARLHPRLTRIFIQQFFDIYPEHGRFDWSRLDPYMDSMARTGAKVVAALTIKPRPLFPAVDHRVWQPNDVAEYQRVVAALVRRYSVEKPIVTYWEIGNETDIGESGGSPFKMDAREYAELYQLTVPTILATFPGAKVGGTAVANASGPQLPEFIDICREKNIRLDFISWHRYHDDPEVHAALVRKYRDKLEGFPGRRPEMLVTEWAKDFSPASLEEMAFDPRRAAGVGATVLAMNDAGLDWSFYYHAWDQTAYWAEFQPFFRDPNIMYHHWNEVPHRFALFGVAGEVRPQYFVFDMLARLGSTRVRAESAHPDVRVLATRAGHGAAALIVNFNTNKGDARAEDRRLVLKWSGLTPGRMMLRSYRIDRQGGWSPARRELLVREQREVDLRERFTHHFLSPADSVALVTLEAAP